MNRIVHGHFEQSDIHNRIWVFVIEAGCCDLASFLRVDGKNQP